MENKTMDQVAIAVVKALGAELFLLSQPKSLVLHALTEAIFSGTLTDVEAYEVVAWYGAEKARDDLSKTLRAAEERRRLNG